MSWHELELLARGGTLSLLALWSWLLWRDHRTMLAARLAIAMNLGIACYVIITVSSAPVSNPGQCVPARGHVPLHWRWRVRVIPFDLR